MKWKKDHRIYSLGELMELEFTEEQKIEFHREFVMQRLDLCAKLGYTKAETLELYEDHALYPSAEWPKDLLDE